MDLHLVFVLFDIALGILILKKKLQHRTFLIFGKVHKLLFELLVAEHPLRLELALVVRHLMFLNLKFVVVLIAVHLHLKLIEVLQFLFGLLNLVVLLVAPVDNPVVIIMLVMLLDSCHSLIDTRIEEHLLCHHRMLQVHLKLHQKYFVVL